MSERTGRPPSIRPSCEASGNHHEPNPHDACSFFSKRNVEQGALSTMHGAIRPDRGVLCVGCAIPFSETSEPQNNELRRGSGDIPSKCAPAQVHALRVFNTRRNSQLGSIMLGTVATQYSEPNSLVDLYCCKLGARYMPRQSHSVAERDQVLPLRPKVLTALPCHVRSMRSSRASSWRSSAFT